MCRIQFAILGVIAAGSAAPEGGFDCPADFNGDGIVNTLDFIAYLNTYNVGDSSADMNGDGVVNTLDFLAFLNAYNEGC